MAFYNGIHAVVRFKNSDVWHFYSKKEKGIFFRRLGKNGSWENPVELLMDTQEDFSVTIDEQDHLHLLCRSNTGEMLYMKYDGKQWSKQVLSRFEPSRHTIRYPAMLIIGGHIHIFFAVGTTFNTGYWSLYHYHWDGDKWHSMEITKFTAGYRISPFYIDRTERHIHLVFRGLASNRYQIYHCRFHIEHGIWSLPENVSHSEGDCSMPAFIVQDQSLHVVWISLFKSHLSVRYRSKPMNNPKAGWSQEMTLSAPGTNCTLPQLVWLEGQLWCIWCQNDTLYGCSLADGGGSFTQPVPLEFEKAEHYYLLNYSTNDPMEKTNFKFHRIPGILDLNLNLPLVNKYMTLPEYTPAPPPSPWESAEVNTSLPRNASRDAANLPPHSLAPSQTSLPAPIRQTYGYKPFEQSLLKEMERQEEHSYTIISKLEDHLKYHEEAMTAMKDLEAQLQQNHAKLHILQQDMEQLQRVMKEFNNRGFLQRILPSLNKNRADKI